MTINKKTRAIAACLVVILILTYLSGCDTSTSTDNPPNAVDRKDGLYINGLYVDMSVQETGSYFYDQLTDSEKTMYTASLIALQSGNNVYELVGVDCDEYVDGCKRSTEALLRDHPEIFWIDGGNRVRSTWLEENTVGSVEITLSIQRYWEGKDIQRAQEELDLAVSELLTETDAFDTPYEKAKFLNGWLAEHIEYDRDSLDFPSNMDNADKAFANTMYGALVARKTLCGGYAATFSYVLNHCGVKTIYVTGTTVDGLHAWNLVELGAEFYHIDTTWADDNNKDGVLYSYFGLDEEEMSLTHAKDDLFDYPIALGVEYDYFRREGLYLEAYSFNKYNAIFSKNYSGGEFSVKFPSEVVLRAAVKDIIENSKFYKLDGMADAGVFSYVVDDIHCILTLYP